MMDIMKKLSAPAYLLCVSAVAALVGLIVAVVSCSGEGFGMSQMPMIVFLTIVAIFLAVGALYLAGKNGDGMVTSVIVLAMVVALSFCIFQLVLGKSDVFGTVIFSDLEKGYAPAERASYLGIVSIVIYIVAVLISSVSAFFRFSKNN